MGQDLNAATSESAICVVFRDLRCLVTRGRTKDDGLTATSERAREKLTDNFVTGKNKINDDGNEAGQGRHVRSRVKEPKKPKGPCGPTVSF